MRGQIPDEEWASIYFKKRGQENEYTNFKSSSFKFQSLINKYFLVQDSTNPLKENKAKQIEKTLQKVHEEIVFQLGGISEQLRFMKFDNFSTLLDNFQSLFVSLYGGLVKGMKFKFSNQGQLQPLKTSLCSKCKKQINQIQVQQLFNQISLTQGEGNTSDEVPPILSKEERKKTIQQLNEYDFVVAEKENYIKKVNQILLNEDKVGCLLSEHKTANFLAEYLHKTQMLQNIRVENGDKSVEDQRCSNSAGWEEQSYCQVLSYIKELIKDHFANECSGPAKDILSKIKIEDMFKSYDEKRQSEMSKTRFMRNQESQTLEVTDFQYLQSLQKKISFQQKEVSVWKANKEEIEQKYLANIEALRKLEGEAINLRNSNKLLTTLSEKLEREIQTVRQDFKNQALRFEAQKQSQINEQLDERIKFNSELQKMEKDFRKVSEEHSRCGKGKSTVHKRFICSETQTERNQDLSDEEKMIQTSDFALVKKRSVKNKYFGSKFSRNFNQKQQGQAFTVDQEIIQKEHENFQGSVEKVRLESKVYEQIIEPKAPHIQKKHSIDHQQEISELRTTQTQKKVAIKQSAVNAQQLKSQRLIKTSNSLSSLRKSAKQQNFNKVSRKDLKQLHKPSVQNRSSENLELQQSKSAQKYRFSKFKSNRLTEISEQVNTNTSINSNKTKAADYNPYFDSSMRAQKLKKIYNVSDRLYPKDFGKEQQSLPFERVIENNEEKFFIKKISRKESNFKYEKERIKELSQTLKPYVYSQNLTLEQEKIDSKMKINELKKRISIISSKGRNSNLQGFSGSQSDRENQFISTLSKPNNEQSLCPGSPRNSQSPLGKSPELSKIGSIILEVQQIIEMEFSYLKAVGFIDFILKIGKENKRKNRGFSKPENSLNTDTTKPTFEDLELFGSDYFQVEAFVQATGIWSSSQKQETTTAFENSELLEFKVQKYFDLLSKKHPPIYQSLMSFFENPLKYFSIQGEFQDCVAINRKDQQCIAKLFGRLQALHKTRHERCSQIFNFLEKIGFYKYTYF